MIVRQQAKEIFQKHLASPVISLRRIPGGAASIVFVIVTKSGSYVIKMRPLTASSYDRETLVLRKKSVRRFGPKVYVSGSTKEFHFTLQEFIPGRRLPWMRASDKQVKAAAVFLRSLHSATKQRISSNHDHIKEKLRYVRRILKSYARFVPRSDALRLKAALDITSKLSIPRIPIRIVIRHGDPNPHNFIIQNNRIRAVDWESAVPGPAVIDITDFILKANLSRKKQKLFLRSYGWKDQKSLRVFGIYRLLGMTAWHLEQYAFFCQGKIPTEQYIPKKRRYWLFSKRLSQIEVAVRD